MKKLLLTIAFLFLCSIAFPQIQILGESQVKIDIEDQVTIRPYENKGFILVQKAFDEKAKKEITWRFTLYNYDLSEEWAKSVVLKEGYYYGKMDYYNGNIMILFWYSDNGGGYSSSTTFTIANINSDGAVSKKEFELKKTPYTTSLHLVDGSYYFNTTTRKSLTKISENMCAIDLETMNLSQKPMEVPENCHVIRSFFAGNTNFYRVSTIDKSIYGSNKKPEYDCLYSVTGNEIVGKLPLKLGTETNFDNLSMVSTDSTHNYFLGISKKWIKGDRDNNENYDYNLFLNKVTPTELEPFRNLDKKYLYELASKTEIAVKNGGFGSEKKLTDNNYVISSAFRYNNKNFVVFDKYQTKMELITNSKYIMNYLFTNSLIWCFDDEGEIEWTKNIDYSIISDNLEPKTKAFPYKNNTIAFIGEFEKGVSLITLSLDGDVLDGSEKYPTLKVLDMDEDLVYKNSITPLFGNKYLVWSKENVTSEEAKMKKKKKIYTIGLNLKVIEIQ
jgi:hypothetical protein